jgi:hypothetical protein
VSISEFEQLLEAMLPKQGRAMLTLTEAPLERADMLRLLERSIVIGNRRGAPLSEIHLPVEQYHGLSDRFWHVPVEDSTNEGVIRLVFESAPVDDDIAA